MAQRKNKDRKQNVQNFKNQQQQASEKQANPKTHLIPKTEWQSADTLELRGDLLEAIEHQMVALYQAQQQLNADFQRLGQALQMVMQMNIKAGKIKLGYEWNNGEAATEQEVKDFQEQMEKIYEARKQQEEDAKIAQNSEKTGLVGLDGEPIGTTQELKEGSGLILPVDTDDENDDRRGEFDNGEGDE